jgi:hypothetical protein
VRHVLRRGAGKPRAHSFARRHVLDRGLHHVVALPGGSGPRAGRVGIAGRDAFVARPFVARLHADFIVDIQDAPAIVGDVLDPVFGDALLDVAAQGDLAVLDFDITSLASS